MSSWIYQNFLDRGYHLVTVSYRFAPIASIADMVEDCTDAHVWCRKTLPTLLPNVDIDAYAVTGDSAGGALSTLLGGLLQPPPRAVLDDQGIVDLSDDWFDTHPDAPTPYSGEFTPEQVAAGVACRDLSQALIACPHDATTTEAALQAEFKTPTVKFGRPERLQLEVRRALAEKSAWVRSVVHPEKFASEAAVKAALREWSSLHRLDDGRTTYPPTFFLHGEEDDCVPVTQSKRMAARLKEMGVPVGEHYEPGVGHCFNQIYSNDRSVEGWERCVLAPVDFIDKHVRGL